MSCGLVASSVRRRRWVLCAPELPWVERSLCNLHCSEEERSVEDRGVRGEVTPVLFVVSVNAAVSSHPRRGTRERRSGDRRRSQANGATRSSRSDAIVLRLRRCTAPSWLHTRIGRNSKALPASRGRWRLRSDHQVLLRRRRHVVHRHRGSARGPSQPRSRSWLARQSEGFARSVPGPCRDRRGEPDATAWCLRTTCSLAMALARYRTPQHRLLAFEATKPSSPCQRRPR